MRECIAKSLHRERGKGPAASYREIMNMSIVISCRLNRSQRTHPSKWCKTMELKIY